MIVAELIDGEVINREVADVPPTAEELRRQRLTDMEKLKQQLAESDYKVIKLAEAMAIGGDMPYNAMALHNERQALRDRINALESEVGDEGE